MTLDRYRVALVVSGVGFGLMAALLADFGRPWAWLAVATVPVALALPRRYGALALIFGSLVLRLAYAGTGQTDQILVAQAAAEHVLGGGNPYGVGYTATIPPGAPYPYGPLGLVWWLPGWPVELVASGILLWLVARQRAWLTFAVLAAFPPFVYLTPTGINDYSPTLLIAFALIGIESHPRLAAISLAAASALKPYAAAWFLPMIGFGGIPALTLLVITSLLLWGPALLAWGLPNFVRSIELANEVVHYGPNAGALNLPLLRLAAVPLTAASLFIKSWHGMVLMGCAIYAVVLFLGGWASIGYWLPLVVGVGLVAERRVNRPRDR